MKIALAILILVWSIWVYWVYKKIKNAPEGYEKNGKFYYGKEPTKKENDKHE